MNVRHVSCSESDGIMVNMNTGLWMKCSGINGTIGIGKVSSVMYQIACSCRIVIDMY